MRQSTWLFAAALALSVASPDEARACGGTFCDSGPNAMPVEQSGENVLFVFDGTTVEAHVQIQYQGAAERFAWIVPMQKIPEVTVGSQLLFQNLLQATVPSYGFNTQQDSCGPQGSGASSGVVDGGGFGGSGGSAGTGGGGPTVVYEKTVGAFEVVALQGGTAQEVSDWLVTNNYQTIPNAAALLQDYVVKGYVFIALKMTAGADVSEIHPLVFEYEGNEPCVPIKLTAVAATEDMGLRVFFLGDDRAVPLNYKEITLNPVRLDWMNLGSNYNQLVSRAADSAVANGKAFVTEYAGNSNVVNTFGVYSPGWNATAFQSIPPENVLTELGVQGLTSCFQGGSCQYNHPLIQSLLQKYLPVPAGLTDADFYGCLSCYKDQIDLAKWSASAFAADLQSRIVDPGKHAVDLLGKWPYLTRMFTTISPAEMTEDPMFYTRPGLPQVQLPAMATQRVVCDGQRGMLLPDGRQVGLGLGSSWPAFDSNMPWVEEITEYPEGKAPIVLVDNTETIDQELKSWNDALGWPPPGSGGSAGSSGSGFGGSALFDPNQESDSAAGGCACAAAGGKGDQALLVGLAALGLAMIRRRRR